MEDPKFMLKLLVGLFAIAFVFSFFGSFGDSKISAAVEDADDVSESVTGLSVFGKLSNVFSNPKSLITGKVVGAQCQNHVDCSMPNEFCNSTWVSNNGRWDRVGGCVNVGCDDSDDGSQPLWRGNASANYYDGNNYLRYESMHDRCNDRNTLNESICSNGRVSVQAISCPEGSQCQAGLCVDQILRWGEGHPCEINEDCQEGLVCRKALNLNWGLGGDRCGQPLEDGAWCNIAYNECRSGNCQGTQWSARCAAAPVVQPQGGEGQACIDGRSCSSSRLKCLIMNNNPPTCVARQAGDQCVADADCPESIPCLGGLCTPRRAGGEFCVSNEICQEGLICQNNACTVAPVVPAAPVLAAEGGACGRDAECQEGLVCDALSHLCEMETCVDSDSGTNPTSSRGTVTLQRSVSGNLDGGGDSCNDLSKVVELSCGVPGDNWQGFPATEVPCPQGTQCQDGACAVVLLKENGGRCANNAECQSNQCKIDRGNAAKNKCVECLSNNACVGREDGKTVCKISVNSCVTCTNNSHCAGRADGSTQCNTRTNNCEQPPMGGVNQACRPEEDPAGRCNRGLECRKQGNLDKCTAVGIVGKPCRTSEPKCNAGLQCNNANICARSAAPQRGAQAAVGGLNQSCRPNNTCNAGLTCKMPEKKCKKANGQSCKSNPECASNKCQGPRGKTKCS